MARPLKVGLDYFPHDVDASSDEKIEFLRAKYKNDGYAFYFITLERIYRTDDGKLILGEIDKRILAKKIGISLDKFNRILNDCLTNSIFTKSEFENHSIITSPGIQRRFLEIQAERERKRSYYKKEKRVLDVQNEGRNTGEKGGESTQSKVKKSIIKELALRLITPIKEQSFYSVLGKYTKELGEKEIEAILARCIANDSKFENENKLAAYLETCKKKNGHAKVTDGLQFINEENEGWM